MSHIFFRLSIGAAYIAAASTVAATQAAAAQESGPATAEAIVIDVPEDLPTCPVESAPPDEPEGESFVMPTTGFVFTLPTPADAAEPEPCVEPGPPAPVRPAAPSLFRMVALPIGNGANAMLKWDAAREIDLASQSGPWDEFLSQARQVSGDNPVAMVNRWVNWRVRYEDDRDGDQWASAPATLTRGYGDCEDFALAKMALLQALGIPMDDMYLVLLEDRQRTDHAVLAVRQDDRMLILDNRTDKVLPAVMVTDYTPTFGYSGSFSWTYGKAAR